MRATMYSSCKPKVDIHPVGVYSSNSYSFYHTGVLLRHHIGTYGTGMMTERNIYLKNFMIIIAEST